MNTYSLYFGFAYSNASISLSCNINNIKSSISAFRNAPVISQVATNLLSCASIAAVSNSAPVDTMGGAMLPPRPYTFVTDFHCHVSFP